MTFLRSLLFNLFFFVSTFVLSLAAAIVQKAAPARLLGFTQMWARLQIAAVRVICGIRLDVQGQRNLPDGPVLIAARHESAFDILAWMVLVPDPCFVVKHELTKIPVVGSLISAVGMIVVDRQAGAATLRPMLRQADRAAALGRQIVIFPEGTRCDPGEYPPPQPGIAALAARTRLPVLPVTTNAGAYWGRRAFAKRPGTIQIVIHPPLDPKLDRAALLARLAQIYRSGQIDGS